MMGRRTFSPLRHRAPCIDHFFPCAQHAHTHTHKHERCSPPVPLPSGPRLPSVAAPCVPRPRAPSPPGATWPSPPARASTRTSSKPVRVAFWAPLPFVPINHRIVFYRYRSGITRRAVRVTTRSRPPHSRSPPPSRRELSSPLVPSNMTRTCTPLAPHGEILRDATHTSNNIAFDFFSFLFPPLPVFRLN